MKDDELRAGQVFSWAQLKEELDVEPEPFGEFEEDPDAVVDQSRLGNFKPL